MLRHIGKASFQYGVHEQESDIIKTRCIAKGDIYCRFEVGEVKA